jgi:uncharacterized phage protein (TIGR01671 family)
MRCGMGQEIKFRAWEKHLKEMIPVHDIDFEKKIINVASAWRLFNEIEIMQYTGLKDCDGKDLYEGDICELRTGYGMYGTKGIVGFETGEFFFINLQEGLYGEFKIIGNIYENPKIMLEV